MQVDPNRLLWLCGCCGLIETSFRDEDEGALCSLCRVICTPERCLVLAWIGKETAPLTRPEEEA